MITIYISKSDSSLPVDWDAMPENAKNHIIEYGLRQKLNDAGSSATTKELGKDEAGKQALAMAENVLESLMQGKVTVRQATSALTLEERAFNRILKALAKKLGLGEDFDLDKVAAKLGKPSEALSSAITAKALAEVEVAKKVAAIRDSIPDIEL